MPSTLPTALRKLPFFYGWVIVGVAMLSGFLGAGVNNVAMAVVFKPLSEDLGWSRSLTTGAIAGGTVLGGVLAPLFGRLADRFGPRLLVPLGAALVGLAAALASFIVAPWQFYLTYIPARALAQTLLFGVVPLAAVTNWFSRQRPRALGLISMAVPIGSSALALFYQFLISWVGWRAVFLCLAILLWSLVLLPGVLLLRRQPEDVGLRPDGDAASEGDRSTPAGRPHRRSETDGVSWTLDQALRTRTLWLLGMSAGLSVISTGGIAFHMVAYFTDLGIEPVLAAGALGLFALAGGVANGLWGFLAERVSARQLFITSLALAGLSVLLLLQVRAVLLAYAFALVFGVSARGQDALLQILVAHYFGRRSFGAISGFLDIFWRAGLGVGPLFAAAVFDLSGGYFGAFAFFCLAFLTASVLVFLSRRPMLPSASNPLPSAG